MFGSANVMGSKASIWKTAWFLLDQTVTRIQAKPLESGARPTTIDVTTCSLDNPDAFRPTHHSWLRHDLKWVKFGDDPPTFAQSRT